MPDDISQIKLNSSTKTDSILEPPTSKFLEEGDHSIEKISKMEIISNQNAKMTDSKKILNNRFMNYLKLHLGRKGAVILITFFTSTFIILFLGVLFGVIPALNLYSQGKVLAQKARELNDSTSSQDINIIESKYKEFKDEFVVFEDKFDNIYWARRLPFVGGYVQDARYGLNAGLIALDTGDIAIETIKPYADIIGLGGAGSSEQETANDRIDFLVNTIDEVLPRIDEINQKISLIQTEINKIDVSKYPEEFRGRKIREPLTQAQSLLDESATFLVESKPLLERASYLLGTNEPREYLLIFQNDNELRPTGGFISAYSILRVTNGKIENVQSNDIYDLDGRYTPVVEAPKVVRDYLKGPYLISDNYRLRDMNWNPDFVDSFELFINEAKKAGINDIDGIVAVDTQVVLNILNAIGPVQVPGYGEFSTNNDERCDCPNVIYELADFANNEGPVVWNQDGSGEIIYAPENYGRRKEVIGPLMNSVLSNALGQPKEKMDELFSAAWKSVTEKHVMVYLFDETAQKGAEGANLSGRIDRDYAGDYLHINDANLGGRKSNLYVTHEVVQDIEVAEDGSITKTVTISYANPQSFDGWLNSVLPNWTRVYVPKGSELISADGFDNQAEVYEELDKTVFAGGFELRPEGLKKITIKYKLPQNLDFNNEYNLLIQKQPGKDFILHTINVGKQTQELFLRTDKEFKFSL